jgi:hypothetical protein
MQALMNNKLYYPAGFLTIGPPDLSPVKGAKEAGDLYNLPYTMFDRNELLDKYPMFRVDSD